MKKVVTQVCTLDSPGYTISIRKTSHAIRPETAIQGIQLFFLCFYLYHSLFSFSYLLHSL